MVSFFDEFDKYFTRVKNLFNLEIALKSKLASFETYDFIGNYNLDNTRNIRGTIKVDVNNNILGRAFENLVSYNLLVGELVNKSDPMLKFVKAPVGMSSFKTLYFYIVKRCGSSIDLTGTYEGDYSFTKKNVRNESPKKDLVQLLFTKVETKPKD